MKVYDERAVVEAFIDAQRAPYPHEDFRTFRRARLAALEKAYGIRMTYEGCSGPGSSLWMLFESVVDSYLRLSGPRAGFLEDTLINVTIERVDSPELKLQETERGLHQHLAAAREAHLMLLVSLFQVLWRRLEPRITAAELLAQGFDEGKAPQLSDYYDEM